MALLTALPSGPEVGLRCNRHLEKSMELSAHADPKEIDVDASIVALEAQMIPSQS